jgi:hypothetical protein
MTLRSHLLAAGAVLLVVLLAGAPPTSAGIDLKVDATTLTELLAVMMPSSVALDLTPDNRVTLRIDDLKVTGFDPAAGNSGHVLTSLRLESPEMGLTVPLKPRLSLHLSEKDGRSVCSLRFEEVVLPIPLSGPLDIAGLLPAIPVPADQINTVQTARGVFNVRTRLVETHVGTSALHFGFDIEVSPAGAARP